MTIDEFLTRFKEASKSTTFELYCNTLRTRKCYTYSEEGYPTSLSSYGACPLCWMAYVLSTAPLMHRNHRWDKAAVDLNMTHEAAHLIVMAADNQFTRDNPKANLAIEQIRKELLTCLQ